MDKDVDRAKRRVRALLTLAREMAWDAFDSPSEEVVMQLFDRLCLELDEVRDREKGLPPCEPGDDRVLH
ncbi:hypothetical protein V8Z80_08390 [Orrella sp. JC864]|uniref:hypothetical protein n=1 Tax=Orrella sp. JC864 TaxID=3120298 RepID=UPI003009A39B